MTFEAYLDGALWFQMNEWHATADNQRNGNGDLIGGEWCDIQCISENYESAGSRWWTQYEIQVEISAYARLDRTVVSTVFGNNPHGNTSPDYTFNYGALGIGHRTEQVRIAGSFRGDCEKYPDGQTTWRMDVKLYFTRASQKILRDPNTNNIILRAAPEYGDFILRDV